MTTPLHGGSGTATVAAVTGANTSAGDGVSGTSATGNGVHGVSTTAFGVLGQSTSGRGVVALSDTDYALRAASRTMPGIRSSSELGTAIEGWAKGTSTGVAGLVDGPGVGLHGITQGGDGVVGEGHRGVVGTSKEFQGVYGHSDTNAGVVGESQTFDGVFAVTHNPQAAAVSGHNPGGMAGFFDGDVVVTGDLVLAGADYAESFDADDRGGELPEPGSVVVLGGSGGVALSASDYDRRVVGVVSGAGRYRPGVVLDGTGDQTGRVPLALMGKVYCKVDATGDPVQVGDLLTTSTRPGHAMRASDPARTAGAVIGKALEPCSGRGLIPILVALQ